MSQWVFGYGSLVAPASIGSTIGRVPVAAVDLFPATLETFGRRWNYGSLRQRADWVGPNGPVASGVVVSLGIEPSPGERTNGAIVRVDGDELARLDERESDYDRIDVTGRVRGTDGLDVDRVVWTYLPRASAIARYEAAAAAGRAAVRSGYVALVEEAFASLGAAELVRYRRSTPDPAVPVVDVDRLWLEPRPEG